ncbi:MAG: hypothetical protein KAY24_19895, partial [Candidatus Eisenbacteria sp.]|nr:hypothetical protein [Candidatus Eisenbacteria bacterium]
MAARSGKGLQLRAAAEYAAVDTFYPCETVLTMGTGANCLRLYVASTVDNPGDVEFYVKHRAGNNKDWHDYCTSE